MIRPTPWTLERSKVENDSNNFILGADGIEVANVELSEGERIVAAVNACSAAGLSNASLEAGGVSDLLAFVRSLAADPRSVPVALKARDVLHRIASPKG